MIEESNIAYGLPKEHQQKFAAKPYLKNFCYGTSEIVLMNKIDKPCLYFLEGNCKKGRNCPYNHDMTEVEKINITCKAWKDGGNCRWGKWCRYM